MEKGQVRSFDHSHSGTIADGQGLAIHFSNSDIVSRHRGCLKAGDFVWFERIGIKADTRAINIRRC